MADRRIGPELYRLHTVLKCGGCGSELIVRPEDHSNWPWCCGRPLLIKGWSHEQLHGRPFRGGDT